MNHKHIKAAKPDNVRTFISVLKRVQENKGRFSICYFAMEGQTAVYETDESEYHRCGTTACALGWLKASPEYRAIFPKESTSFRYWTMPMFGEATRIQRGYLAAIQGAAKWLGIPGLLAHSMFGGQVAGCEVSYGKSPEKVTVADVIAKLEELL